MSRRQCISIKFPRVPQTIDHLIEAQGRYAPWLFLALFIASSFLMIWRLEVLSSKGFEGTVLGTLVMPYCTGLGNLIFAFILGRTGGSGADVMTNSLVNNVTNMTLVLGLPAILWGMHVLPKKKPARKNANLNVNLSVKKKPAAAGKAHELNRLSLLLTLTAVLFFTGAVWALARAGRIEFEGGLVLVGLFLFWQCFHIFEVMKNNVRQGRTLFRVGRQRRE
jgi:cation:H+ antiporter